MNLGSGFIITYLFLQPLAELSKTDIERYANTAKFKYIQSPFTRLVFTDNGLIVKSGLICKLGLFSTRILPYSFEKILQNILFPLFENFYHCKKIPCDIFENRI